MEVFGHLRVGEVGHMCVLYTYIRCKFGASNYDYRFDPWRVAVVVLRWRAAHFDLFDFPRAEGNVGFGIVLWPMGAHRPFGCKFVLLIDFT